MLSKSQFEVLYCLKDGASVSQRSLSDQTGFSLGKINRTVRELKDLGYLSSDTRISENGMKELNVYKVDNAIILAAGKSSRFIPISYEHPKGLTVVRGEVLIERQIRQLQQAGIPEVVVVIGHMQEKFYYLEQKFGVILVTNNDFKTKNTHSSIYAAREYLHSSYICCSDNYYPRNLFRSHEYHSMYCTQFQDGYSRTERGVITNTNGLIISTQKPSEHIWTIQGHAYMNHDFSRRFLEILDSYYGVPGTDALYWEEIYAENLNELPLYERKCLSTDFYEFDTAEDLRRFDPDFLLSNNTHVVDHICNTLDVQANEINDITALNAGLTNQSFRFSCKGIQYVYREPGKGTSAYIDRKREMIALETARDLGIDESYLRGDPEEGWKISYYVEVSEPFDFQNTQHLKMLCSHLKKLHDSRARCGSTFDYLSQANLLLQKISSSNESAVQDMSDIAKEIEKIHASILADDWPTQLAHNDIFESNLLVAQDKLYLIDWEFAGDTDIGYDICKLFTTTDTPKEALDEKLFCYYNRQPTEDEKRHLVGCAAICYYLWFVWAIYQNQLGYNYHDLETKWYKRMRMYINMYYKFN